MSLVFVSFSAWCDGKKKYVDVIQHSLIVGVDRYFGTCIGEQNHATFVAATIVHAVLAGISAHLFHATKQAPDSQNSALTVLMFMLSCTGALGFGSIAVMHIALLASGTTTYEMVRRSRLNYMKSVPTGVNPFDLGFVANIATAIHATGGLVTDWAAMLPESLLAPAHDDLAQAVP